MTNSRSHIAGAAVSFVPGYTRTANRHCYSYSNTRYIVCAGRGMMGWCTTLKVHTMCSCIQHKTLCRTCVVNFNIARDPTSGLTLILTRTRTPTLWLEVGRGSHAAPPPRVLVAFFHKKSRAAERLALTNETRIQHKVLCRRQLHIGRVLR